MNRTVFKVLAIVVLAGIIVGVSVLKSSISAKRQKAEVASIKDEYFRTRDGGLLKMLDDSTRVYVDSIQKLETYYQDQIDSLNMLYAKEEGLLETADTSEGQLSRALAFDTSIALDSTALLMLTEYKVLFKKLPGDLTAYEKKVSIRELTVELSKKYKISPDSVKKIITARI